MRKTGKYKSILKANLMLEQRFIGNGESSVLTEEVTFDTTDLDDAIKVINGKNISLRLEDGVDISGVVSTNKNRLFQLSLEVVTDNGSRYGSFYDNKFMFGGNEVVAGSDKPSEAWLKTATKAYRLAEMETYPEKFAEMKTYPEKFAEMKTNPEKFAKYTEKGERPIVILPPNSNKNDWSEEIRKLKKAGYKWSSGNELNTDKDVTGMPGYTKFPYIIYVNDDNKTVDYRGEHTSFK
jgi:hypothetical protein